MDLSEQLDHLQFPLPHKNKKDRSFDLSSVRIIR